AHHEVVRGDHRLRREGHDLLAQVDPRAHAIDEGGQKVEPRVEGLLVTAEPLDDEGDRLRHDAHRAHDRDDDEDRRDTKDDVAEDCRRVELVAHVSPRVGEAADYVRGSTTAVAPSMRTTRTCAPSGICRPGVSVRAVHTSPTSLTRPPTASTSATTCAVRPTCAAALVSTKVVRLRQLRTSHRRSVASRSTATTSATTICPHTGTPSAAAAAPPSAPPASMSRNRSSESTSISRNR